MGVRLSTPQGQRLRLRKSGDAARSNPPRRERAESGLDGGSPPVLTLSPPRGICDLTGLRLHFLCLPPHARAASGQAWCLRPLRLLLKGH